jgi:ABC-2 type transport system permease protein
MQATLAPLRRPPSPGRLGALRGAIASEYRMQVRRPVVWILIGVLGAWVLRVNMDSVAAGMEGVEAEVGAWAWLLQVFTPIAVGVLLADRFARDRRSHVDEILESTPAADWVRLLGKYLGATAATLTPMLLVYVIGLAWLATQVPDPGMVARLAVPAFLVVNLPGLLFVAAYSVCCPIVMKVPLYQFLFVGYWFWGNLMPPQIMPTLRDTWLAPIGWVAEGAFFHPFAGGSAPVWTVADAIASMALLLAGAAAALIAGVIALRLQRARA